MREAALFWSFEEIQVSFLLLVPGVVVVNGIAAIDDNANLL